MALVGLRASVKDEGHPFELEKADLSEALVQVVVLVLVVAVVVAFVSTLCASSGM
jgi:hypothetical protein